MAKDKRITKAYEAVDQTKSYPLPEAIKLIKQNAKAKFDETIEMSMNLGIDPRHADQMVRGLTSLPNGTGKTVRVGVFARGPKAEEAQAAGSSSIGRSSTSTATFSSRTSRGGDARVCPIFLT